MGETKKMIGNQHAKKENPKVYKTGDVRLSDEEKEIFLKKVELSGLKKAVYIREAILNREIKQPFTKEESEAFRSLIGMGRNLNQLTMKKNAGGFTTADLEELRKLIKEINLAITYIRDLA